MLKRYRNMLCLFAQTARFTRDDISSCSLLKNSATRGIKSNILEQMPNLVPILDVIMPKKAAVYNVKWFGKIMAVVSNEQQRAC